MVDWLRPGFMWALLAGRFGPAPEQPESSPSASRNPSACGTAVESRIMSVWNSCGHTDMVELDDHTALLVYSDFNHPDGDGVPRKTILVRRVQVDAAAQRQQLRGP
jgi:hypothetical protein